MDSNRSEQVGIAVGSTHTSSVVDGGEDVSVEEELNWQSWVQEGDLEEVVFFEGNGAGKDSATGSESGDSVSNKNPKAPSDGKASTGTGSGRNDNNDNDNLPPSLESEELHDEIVESQPANLHEKVRGQVEGVVQSELSDSEDEDESAAGSNLVDENRILFRRASRHINPGAFFRFVIYLYSERKLVVLFWLHFVATMVIYAHYFLIKNDEKKQSVSEDDPNYWWKRIIPPLDFGAMHAILFQMALIPLTMSRNSIAAFSESVVNRFIPLGRMTGIHIHLGYVMLITVYVDIAVVFVYSGLLCHRGDEFFCDKFSSEIMITGYLILAALIVVGVTSYFRHKIRYEIFYAVHQVVFLMYLLAIIHTIDNVGRDKAQRNRSQTFKWFSCALLYYVCDRVAMHLNHRYEARVTSSAAVEGADGSRMLLIKMRRPALFQFKPGQYAFIMVPSVDAQWHPFSIASGPSSSYLEFCIEVFGPESWTGKLWDKLGGDSEGGVRDADITLDIMGPYGTSLGNLEDYSHGLAIGAGTGVVPILSMFQSHVRQVLRLSPDVHFRLMDETRKHREEFEMAEEARKGTLVSAARCRPKAKNMMGFGGTKKDRIRQTIRKSFHIGDDSEKFGRHLCTHTSAELKRAAFAATKSIYGCVAVGLLAAFGCAVFGLTISWNTIPITLYSRMVDVLMALTVLFQVLFAIVATCVWNGNHQLGYIDVMFCIACIPGDILWAQEYQRNGVLCPSSIVLLSLLTGYMTARLWVKSVWSRHTSWKHSPGEDCAGTMERLDVVWTSRSASLIAELYPDIDKVWEEIVYKWGLENAKGVVRFSIYCTDPDETARDTLKEELKETALYRHGFVHFGRPDFGQIIQNHTLELIDHSRSSSSLLAFCGSPTLAQQIHHHKVSNEMLTAITGHKEHQMEFVSECYGGVPSRKKKDTGKKEDTAASESTNGNGNENQHRDISSASLSKDGHLTRRRFTKFQNHGERDPLQL